MYSHLKNHKLLTFLVTFLALAFFLAACASPSSTPLEEDAILMTPEPTVPPSGRGAGDTLRMLYWEAPAILNPHLSSALKDWEASRITYEPLASFDREGNMVPFLAAEIPSLSNGGVAADGLSVTWKLKNNVFWSDGTPFTAADVRFTFEYITNPAVGSFSTGSYEAIADVEIIDDYTVKINFIEQNPAWTLPFVGVQGMILPRHIFEPYNGANAREAPANLIPVGTGPYYVVEFKPQEVLFFGTELVETNKIIYEPNPYFRESDKPYFRRVELKGGGTVNEAARSVLRDGIVDYAYALQVTAQELAQMEEGGQGRVLANFGPAVEIIEFNRTDPNRETADGERSSIQFPHPFFSDHRVLEAFSLAIDRERIADIYGVTGRLTSNVLVAPTNYYSPNTAVEYNLTKAAFLLDEAGWVDSNGDGIRDKEGQRLSVLYQAPYSPIREQIQQIVKTDLESIGIEVQLKIIDVATFFGDDVFNPNNGLRFQADMQQLDILSSSPDPGPFLQWWICSQIPQRENEWGGFNSPRWCNEEYDALYRQSNIEMDPELREQIFIQMNDLIIQEFVTAPLVHLADVSGVSRSLEEIELTPWDTGTWNIKDWRRISP